MKQERLSVPVEMSIKIPILQSITMELQIYCIYAGIDDLSCFTTF